MAYAQAGVATPSRCPLLWEGKGKVKVAGRIAANPALQCPDPNSACRYVPRSLSGCAPGNGGQDVIYTLAGGAWIHNQGAVFVMADGSAKWRRLGATINEATDRNTDPGTQYDGTGVPKYYWTNGCHTWLFRPDFEQP
jgi:hypothetical protein